MKKIFYSGSNNAFYDSYIYAGLLPSDVVEITKELHDFLLREQSQGKRIISNDSGLPISIDAPSAPVEEILESAKNELRTIREPMLSAVTGIGWDALASGDDALVQEARNIRNALRDITDDPALNAAQTYEDMRAAGVAAYRRIAAGASPAFAATFKEFTGA